MSAFSHLSGDLFLYSYENYRAALIGVLVIMAASTALVFRKYLISFSVFGKSSVPVVIACYSLCSSSLLIINKVCITFIPAPSLILFCQLLVSALIVWGLSSAGIVSTEELSWESAKKYSTVVIIFAGFLYCNFKALQYVPVDTVICFRASIPLVVAVLDYLVMGHELPKLRSWLALCGVLVGAAVYTHNDFFFSVKGYLWLSAWYTLCVVDALLMKRITDTVPMSTYSRTLYNNALAAPLILVIAASSGEISSLHTIKFPALGVIALAVSCLAGLAMNFFTWRMRELLSATSLTVVGNACKFLTVAINILIWNKHADARGTLALLFCMVSALFYKEAPKRT